MMRVVIIDDDPLFRALLGKFIRMEEAVIAGEFDSPVDAIPVIKELDYDLIFLDLHMPGMAGSEFLEAFACQLPPVIFTTSDPQYAVKAFSYNVIGYLVKPFSYPEFKRAFEKASLAHKVSQPTNEENILFVKERGVIHRIDKRDVLYLECIGDYATIHTATQKFTVHGSMKSFESVFPEPEFMRVHRSFIVRFSSITSVQDDDVVIHDQVIPIGKTYRQEFFSRIRTL